MGFYYRVELVRRVADLTYGPDAYRTDTKRKDFMFGKGKEFTTGKTALAAAGSFAKSMMDKASSVSVWRMSGYGGTGEYLKDDPDHRFSTGWE